MARLARSGNDQLGAELNKFMDQMSFNKTPLVWVPALDNAAVTGDPFYFINKNKFKVHTLKGSYMREAPAKEMPLRHTGRVVNTDTTFQIVCTNRHEQGIVAKSVA